MKALRMVNAVESGAAALTTTTNDVLRKDDAQKSSLPHNHHEINLVIRNGFMRRRT